MQVNSPRGESGTSGVAPAGSGSAAPTTPSAFAGNNAAIEIVSMYVAEQKIQSRSVSGWFAAWRWAVVWVTQVVFYGLPWLQWHDRQAVLFDLEARRFYLFNLVLYPQDFIYLTALLMISAYALFLFTAVAGRLWCGFACPQTVYTEIFMWVEHRVEGERQARIKLDAAPWGFNKLWRRGGKHAAWLLIAFWTGFTFVGYFTPVLTLGAEVLTLLGVSAGGVGLGPWEAFWIFFYGLATYGNAGFLREQVCKYMCPYARFQSAMFDKDTLIIGYDTERGEPRGARGRKADPKQLGLGSCIDCTLCVQVCPTGIDIRKGLQYECIGCAACIDVCDSVMEKMSYPKGLIRYATQHGIEQHWSRAQMWTRVFRPRVLIYTAILVLLCGALVTSLWMRSPFRVDVVRDRASLARLVEDGYIENVYRLQVMNSTEAEQGYRISVQGLPGAKLQGASEVKLASTEARWFAVGVQVPPEAAGALGAGAHPMQFKVEQLARGNDLPRQVLEKSTFVVPR